MSTVKEPTRELVDGIIKSKKLDGFLNLQETSWFEFRKKHYATMAPVPGGPKAKYELAKDCSSIANSGGGYIVIGLKPEIKENQMTEYVSEVVGVKKADINLTSWRDTLLNMLTPRFTPENFEYGFIDIDAEKAVFWMRIPSAEEKGIFPIVLHADQWQADGEKIHGQVIGVYERYGAENLLLSSDKLQAYISQGIANEATGQSSSQELRRIYSKLDELARTYGKNSTSWIDFSDQLKHFAADAYQKLDQDEVGFFYIYAAPQTKTSIPGYWNPYTEDGSISQLMKNPPTLRRMGWDLSVASQEYPTAEPGGWEIKNGNRKMLKVTEKAEIFAAATIVNFLDWGLDKVAAAQGYGKLINEYAFAEFVAMYFAFLKKVKAKTADSEEIKYKISFGFVSSGRISIGMHEPDMMGIPSNGTAGPLRQPSTWTINDISPDEPDVNAGFMVQQIIVSGFGGTQDSQYFVRDGGVLRFDATSYK